MLFSDVLLLNFLYVLSGQADSSSSTGMLGAEAKLAARKAMGVQDSEVSPLEYVQNKIAQCLQDEGGDPRAGPGHPGAQGGAQMMVDPHTGQQGPVLGRSPHSQVCFLVDNKVLTTPP